MTEACDWHHTDFDDPIVDNSTDLNENSGHLTWNRARDICMVLSCLSFIGIIFNFHMNLTSGSTF